VRILSARWDAALLKRKCQFDGCAEAKLALDGGRAAVEIDTRVRELALVPQLLQIVAEIQSIH
jgi:hypothetical protein